MSIKNNLPPSPSGTYVVYDQFHFGSPDHLAIPVKGQSEALDMYRFQSLANPDKSLGLTTAEKYKQYIATLPQPKTPITTMNPKEFFDLVSQMRQAQRDYFKTRTPQSLQESKRLERLVDSEIDRVKKITTEPQLDFG